MNHGKCCPSDTFCSLAQSKIERDHIRVPFHILPVLGNTLTLRVAFNIFVTCRKTDL